MDCVKIKISTKISAIRDMKANNKKVRIPKQKRSINKKNRIMNAAIQLFAQKGIHDTNSKEIAALAGVSIGSFYSYFSDKKVLLIDVLERYLDNHYSEIWKQDSDVRFEEFSKEIIRYFTTNLFRACGISSDFHRETKALRYSDPEVKKLFDEEKTKALKQINAFLEFFKNKIKVADIEAAAIVIHSAAENLAHTTKFIGIKINEARLINEFTNMIYRYLATSE